MAIDTDNKKLSLMELDAPWEPGLPISPGTFGQDDKQQLLWGYPGILWQQPASGPLDDDWWFHNFILDHR